MAQLARLRSAAFVLPLTAAVFAVLLPQLGVGPDVERQVELVAMLTLVVSGLNLSLGYAGELALGQVAMYAAGAYIAGYLSIHVTTDILAQLAVAAAAALAVGLLTGLPGLRLGSWSLAMTSFFLVLLIPDILEIFQNQTGGQLGLVGINPPTLFGVALSNEGYYLVVTIVAVLWLLVMRNLVTSRHGTAFLVVRESPVLASSLGISVYRMKLTAYALGAIPAGLAGALFANLDLYLDPAYFGFGLAITILAASILGGSTSVYGAIIGATILQVGPTEWWNSFNQYELVAYGGFLIAAGVLIGGGVSGLAQSTWRRVERLLFQPAVPVAAEVAPIVAMPGVELSVAEVSKHFGGVAALSDVTLSAGAGKVTAVIGPNGSGKTTLLNVICSYYRLDDGAVYLDGKERPRNDRPHLVARAGVARTFQTTSIPKGVTVADAVRAGRYSGARSGMLAAMLRLPSSWRVRRGDREAVDTVLRQVGLEGLSDQQAASLPLGTRRLLEVGRALIARPRVVLFDEVASGLDEAEVENLGRLIREIRDAGGTVVLVEHNFRLVLALADQIHVLAKGKVIASGTPAEIESHPQVLVEYLGIRESMAEELLQTAVEEGAR